MKDFMMMLASAYGKFVRSPVDVWKKDKNVNTIGKKDFWTVLACNFILINCLMNVFPSMFVIGLLLPWMVINNTSFQIMRLRDVGLRGWSIFWAMVLIFPSLYYFFKSSKSECLLRLVNTTN